MSLSSVTSPVQGIFALQVVVAVLAFFLSLVISFLAFILIIRRSSRHRESRTSPRGTLAFLFPGALCLAIAQAATAASVGLQTEHSSPATVTHAFSLHYQGGSDSSDGSSTTIVNLGFLNAFAFIVSTVCLNGAVWLHSSHATANGLAVGQPSRISIVGNVLLLLLMLGTGFASWGLAMSSYTSSNTYSSVLQNDLLSRILCTVFRACVVAASISVSIEAIRRFVQVKNHSSRNASERPILTRLALVVVPVILLRSIFIVLDIALLWVADSYPNWGASTQEAVAFLLIICGPYAELWAFSFVCWGGWNLWRPPLAFPFHSNDKPCGYTTAHGHAAKQGHHSPDSARSRDKHQRPEPLPSAASKKRLSCAGKTFETWPSNATNNTSFVPFTHEQRVGFRLASFREGKGHARPGVRVATVSALENKILRTLSALTASAHPSENANTAHTNQRPAQPRTDVTFFQSFARKDYPGLSYLHVGTDRWRPHARGPEMEGRKLICQNEGAKCNGSNGLRSKRSEVAMAEPRVEGVWTDGFDRARASLVLI
ncbi:hypothetical protein Q7P37_004982 [Cladosporium fusiforme]